ncbi:uncharacterized protein RCC_08433 [Ramularia collo-cygni]|uniref:Mid2 domain-containing protein n=1 Tax=Ramularia collo-cygni TaxID=112498 RepID=A0A2D3VMC6_9PEZI|nr:uncharacterized protein RCC_08433 [Ramularia collo-cygni]CZT22728.1 uncharacterized protein RCC_08433 [Ramularia collo-cygni]
MPRFNHAPRALLSLLTAILLTPHIAAKPQPHPSEQAGFSFNELFARYDCAGTPCGSESQYCCGTGQACYTDAANIAQCTPSAEGAAITSGGGYWQYYTSTFVETDLVTRTTTMSTYFGGVAPASATGASGPVCNFALNEQPCGNICCASGQYCANTGEAIGQCAAAAGGGSSGYYSSYTATATNGATAGAPIRPTTSAGKTVTTTSGPTTTVPFIAPVATGANITLTEDQKGGNGLSGGAIAGIVIGVLAGLFLLFLLIACCCFKALLDTFLACFGCRKKRRSRVEVEEYERHSHHSRHGGSGGRTWYGAAAKPPTRIDRRDSHKKGKELLGAGAGLAALWAVLGLKRKHDGRKNDEKYSEYSYSSDYYTSASSASSDDRRTRDSRHTRR